MTRALAVTRRKLAAARRDIESLVRRVEQLTTLAITIAEQNRAPVSVRELARRLVIPRSQLTRSLTTASFNAKLRADLEEWLVARGACSHCVRQLVGEDFVALLLQYVTKGTQ